MISSEEPEFRVTDMRRDSSHEVTSGGVSSRACVPHVAGGRALAVRRAIGGVLAVLGILLVLALFFSSPAAQITLISALNLPMPADQLPLAPGADVVYLERGAPWGTLRVDGVTWTLERTDQPYTGKEGVYTAIRLARGRHHIDYAALPFPTLDCVISVPAASGDTCPLITHPGAQDVAPVLAGTRIMDLRATPERLQGSARSALVAAIAATLVSWTPSASVASGEPLLGPQGAISDAAGPLKASLNYTLVDQAVSSSVASADGVSCASICRVDTQVYLDQTTAILPILAHVRANWSYTDAEGRVTTVDTASAPGAPMDGVITLFARWTGFWQVKVPYFGLRNLTCDYAMAALDLQLKPAQATQHIETTAGLNAADGCLVIEQDTGKGGSTSYFLYRFGVLMAANDAAHRALPSLPMVDARARAVARQLGAHLP